MSINLWKVKHVGVVVSDTFRHVLFGSGFNLFSLDSFLLMLKTGETKTVSQKSTETPRLSQFSKPRLAEV